MTKRSTAFHIAAAVAFLTATPLIAGMSGSVFMPNLQYPEPVETPYPPIKGEVEALPQVLMPATGDQATGGWIIEIPTSKQ